MAARVEPVVSYTIPKPSGGTRRMARLTAHDAARWDALAARAVPGIEVRLSRAVLANRAWVHRGSLRLRPLGAALHTARGAAARLSESSAVVLRTDVEACYPSVLPAVAAHAVGRAGGDDEDAALAAGMLEGWGSEGYAGLPVGPEGSAVVANAILATVDRRLAGYPFLRWVDDYLVGLCCDRAAAAVLERIDEALAGVCLRRSEAKTTLTEVRSGLRWPGTSGLPPPSN